MNLLFVTPAPPFPPSDGARLIVANLARALSNKHTLYLACLSETQNIDAEHARHFADVRVTPLRRITRGLKWLSSLVDPVPLWVRAHESDALHTTLRALTQQYSIDVIHFDTGLMAQYGEAVQHIPRIVSPHDSLTHVLEQQAHGAPRRLQRLLARSQVSKMRRYEANTYPSFHRVVFVTESERVYLQSFAQVKTCVIPNGVDTDYFAPFPDTPLEGCIGFSGVMDYVPNQVAALYFAREVLPRIWRQIPDAQFRIIGRNPPAAIRALANDTRILVTDTVPDVRPFLGESSLLVCPIQARGGIKNKLLEALAMGKPVVATPEAADGVTARAGVEFLQAEDATAFANACIQLLKDANLRTRLGQAARAWALENTWHQTARQYETVYREVCA